MEIGFAVMLSKYKGDEEYKLLYQQVDAGLAKEICGLLNVEWKAEWDALFTKTEFQESLKKAMVESETKEIESKTSEVLKKLPKEKRVLGGEE